MARKPRAGADVNPLAVQGINITKGLAYAVAQPPAGINIQKSVGYAVLVSVAPGVSISKALAYAILTPGAVLPSFTGGPVKTDIGLSQLSPCDISIGGFN